MSDAPFYSDEDDEESGDSDEDSEDEEEERKKKKKKQGRKKGYVMDGDHRLLLRNCKPLLQSRNSSVRDHVTWIPAFIAPPLSRLSWQWPSCTIT